MPTVKLIVDNDPQKCEDCGSIKFKNFTARTIHSAYNKDAMTVSADCDDFQCDFQLRIDECKIVSAAIV